jgi:uncharacterized protein (TIGR01777 family)
MTIVIAGGSGFLGQALTARLVADGHSVVILSRAVNPEQSQTANVRVAHWLPDGSAGPWASEIGAADAVVNLAGAGIADKRWSSSRKRLLHDSRVNSTRSLAAAMRAAAIKPKVFIQESAVGFYGGWENGAEFDESASPGSDFLATLCVGWEAEALPIAALDCRLVILRTAIVVSHAGGALPRMLPAFRLFVGGPIAAGRHYMSWVHLDDWTSMVSWAIDNSAVSGPINASAPNPVRNTEFMRAIGRAIHRPSWIPVPGFVLKTLFGEMAAVTLLRGQQVVPKKARDLGFTFRYERIDEAMAAAIR